MVVINTNHRAEKTLPGNGESAHRKMSIMNFALLMAIEATSVKYDQTVAELKRISIASRAQDVNNDLIAHLKFRPLELDHVPVEKQNQIIDEVNAENQHINNIRSDLMAENIKLQQDSKKDLAAATANLQQSSVYGSMVAKLCTAQQEFARDTNQINKGIN